MAPKYTYGGRGGARRIWERRVPWGMNLLQTPCSDGMDSDVVILNMAGVQLARLPIEDFETVRDLKLLLHQRLHVPPLRQRLVRAEGYGGTAEEAEVTEETSQVPKQISLVVLDYQQDLTVHLLNAAEEGDGQKAQRLLKQLADPNGSEGEGWTPLHIAAINGNVDVCRSLMEALAELTRTNSDGSTALHVAAWSGQLQMMRVLCNARASANAAQNEGWAPLHIASRHGHAHVVQFLLEEARVDADVRVDAGWTASNIALWADHTAVLDILEQYAPRSLWQSWTGFWRHLFRTCRRRAKQGRAVG
ncbi:Ankyrin repeat and protein kinase domain-containing protein 1 (Protein kinase PKK2) (Sugen kinase 288) (SgK288) (X-kinase) [Durusdinium trenchii]